MIRSISCGYGSPALPGDSAKSSSVRQNGIRVCLDEIKFVLRRQAQIDAGVAVDRQQAIDAFAGLLDLRDERRVELLRRTGSPIPSVCDIPRPISP